MDKFEGELQGFPVEIVAMMLNRQAEQGNARDISIFEHDKSAGIDAGGFTWAKTPEGYCFWENVIRNQSFDAFFKRYPRRSAGLLNSLIWE